MDKLITLSVYLFIASLLAGGIVYTLTIFHRHSPVLGVIFCMALGLSLIPHNPRKE